MDTLITYEEVAALVANLPLIAPCPNFTNLRNLRHYIQCILQCISCPQSNKLCTVNSNFIFIFIMLLLLITISFKMMTLHPPRDLPWSNLLISCISYLTSIYFWLVVAFTIITWRLSKAKLYFVCDFFVIQIVALSDGATSPYLL